MIDINTFDIDAMFVVIANAFADYPNKYITVEQNGLPFIKEYLHEGDLNVRFHHMHNDVLFAIMVGNYYLLDGTFDIDNKEFRALTHDSYLITLLNQVNRGYEWVDIQIKIQKMFINHIRCFADLSTEQQVLDVTVIKQDVETLLKNMFESYSSFENHEKLEDRYIVRTKYRDLSMRLAYNDSSNDLLRLQVSIAFEKNRFKKELYFMSYNARTGTFIRETGTKPEGFDEGFAPFRLLSSLMH